MNTYPETDGPFVVVSKDVILNVFNERWKALDFALQCRRDGEQTAIVVDANEVAVWDR